MDFEIIFKSAFCLVVGAKEIELLKFPLPRLPDEIVLVIFSLACHWKSFAQPRM